MGGECSIHGRNDKCIHNLYRKTLRVEITWEICRRRWVDNIKMDCWQIVDWTRLTQDRVQWRALVNTETILQVPWKAGNSLSSWTTVSFLRRSCVCYQYWSLPEVNVGSGPALSYSLAVLPPGGSFVPHVRVVHLAVNHPGAEHVWVGLITCLRRKYNGQGCSTSKRAWQSRVALPAVCLGTLTTPARF
jgi:hypothetical protein